MNEDRIKAQFDRGIAVLHEGRLEEAIHHFKELIRMETAEQGGALKGKESILKRLAEGEESLTISVERQDQYHDGFVGRCIIRLSRAIIRSISGEDPALDCKGALGDAARAVELRGEQIPGHLHRANVFIFSARYARDTGKDVSVVFKMARNDIDKALGINPADVVLLHNRGIINFYLANLQKKRGEDPSDQYNEAISDLSKATEMDPTNAYVFKDLGVSRVALARVKLEKGERPKDLLRFAVGDLTMAIEQNPALYGAYYERGMAQFSLKQFEGAIADWTQCLELDPGKEKALKPLIDEATQRMNR